MRAIDARTGVKSHFPLCDEEVLVRNNHRTSRDAVEAYRRETAASGHR